MGKIHEALKKMSIEDAKGNLTSICITAHTTDGNVMQFYDIDDNENAYAVVGSLEVLKSRITQTFQYSEFGFDDD